MKRRNFLATLASVLAFPKKLLTRPPAQPQLNLLPQGQAILFSPVCRELVSAAGAVAQSEGSLTFVRNGKEVVRVDFPSARMAYDQKVFVNNLHVPPVYIAGETKVKFVIDQGEVELPNWVLFEQWHKRYDDWTVHFSDCKGTYSFTGQTNWSIDRLLPYSLAAPKAGEWWNGWVPLSLLEISAKSGTLEYQEAPQGPVGVRGPKGPLGASGPGDILLTDQERHQLDLLLCEVIRNPAKSPFILTPSLTGHDALPTEARSRRVLEFYKQTGFHPLT